MADPRFFQVAGPFSLKELADIAGAEIRAGKPDERFSDVASLDAAGPTDVSFLDNPAYADAFTQSGAGVCIIGPNLKAVPPEGMALLVCGEPYRGYGLIARAFYPDIAGAAPSAGGVAEGAHVDPAAQLGEGVRIDPGAVVGAGAEIGPRTVLGPNVVVGPGCRIGADCVIAPSVSIRYSLIGDRVRIYAGARIGEDGFGYASSATGHLHIPQLGRVVIGNDVEVGANTTIDRGAGPDTVIGDGCIIDNLVQVGHNVRMGKCCVIVAHVGISGSTTLGDYVVIGGQAGLKGHITVGSGVRIGAQAGVISNLEPGITVIGSPAQPYSEFWRQMAALKRLAIPRKGSSNKKAAKKNG